MVTQPVGRGHRPEWTVEPKRASKTAGARRRARALHPFFIRPVRQLRVNLDVSVAIVSPGPLQMHALMPAVHSAHRIGLDGKREVLVNANLAPPDPLAIRIGALERGGSMALPHAVAAGALATD